MKCFNLLFPFLTSQVREGGGIKKKSNRSIFCSPPPFYPKDRMGKANMKEIRYVDPSWYRSPSSKFQTKFEFTSDTQNVQSLNPVLPMFSLMRQKGVLNNNKF